MFESFIKERQYLQNVSPRTIEWYQESFKWLHTPKPTQADLKSFVIRMREKGLKASSCNNRIRAVNAYLQWSESPLRVPKMKEQQRVLPTFKEKDIQKLIAWKPKTDCQRRLHILVLTLSDTGCRIDELLSLTWSDIDFDNLLLTVNGKGSRQRTIPFSYELRKHLWKHKHENSRVFCTQQGKKLGRRDMLRDVKLACKALGIEPPERTLHAFRHTFATHYLQKGGSVVHLQRCLGHSSLDMTMKYVHLQTGDLTAIHRQISLLAT